MKTKLILTLLVFIFLSSCNQINNNEGFSYKLIPVKQSDNYWGYIDANGKVQIHFDYKKAYPFSEGLALVKDDSDKVGYINEYGTYIIKPQYKSGTYFSDGQAFVIGNEGYPECIDKKGTVLFTLKDAASVVAYSEGLAVVYKNGKVGYINKEGKMIINPCYDEGDKFSEGLAAVAIIEDGTKKYGFIDKDGRLVIPYQYSFVTPFSEGKALAVIGTDAHCIGKDGKDIFPADKASYDYAGTFREGYAPAAKGSKVKYIDKTGKIQFDGDYDNGRPFYNGLAAIEKGDKWGYIDIKGKEVINCQFDEASQFYRDFAVVELDGKYGLIDKSGKYTVQPQYPDIFCHYDMTGEDDTEDENIVHSEYVVPEDAVQGLFGNGEKEQVMGIDETRTLQDVIKKIQTHRVGFAGTNSLIDSTNAYISPGALVVRTAYDFSTPIIEGGHIVNVNPKIARITYMMAVKQDGIKVANLIKNKLISKFQAEAVPQVNDKYPEYEYYYLATRTAAYQVFYSDNKIILFQTFKG